MASGLLKFVGRASEQAPDEEMKERIKARMEKMGMVEEHLPQMPQIPARDRANQMSSNRQMIADRARVTPKSLKLARGTSQVPLKQESSWQDHKGSLPPLQRREDLSDIDLNHRHNAEEGGMFDTDAENLDSTTNISDAGEESISRSWHQGDGDMAEDSRHLYQNDSEYPESLPPTGEESISQRANFDENFTGESLDEEVLSEDNVVAYQNTIDRQPQYELEAMQDLLKEQRHNGDNSRMIESPMSRRKAIDVVMDSPSIQQSLAHRIIAGRPKQSRAAMPPMFGASNHDAAAPIHDDKNEGAPRPQRTEKPAATVEVFTRDPLNIGNTKQTPQDTLAQNRSGRVTKEHREQSPQELSEAFEPESLRDTQWHSAKEESGFHLWSRNELESPRSVAVGQRMPKAEEQPTTTAGNKYGAKRILPDYLIERETSKATWQHLVPSQGSVDTQTVVSSRLPVQAAAQNLAAPLHQDIMLPQHLDGQQSGNRSTPDLVSVKGPAANGKKTLERGKRDFELDYSPKELSGMTYKLLNSESFDHIPKAALSSLSAELAAAPLTEKIQHAYGLKDNSERPSQRQGVFNSLTIEEYEEAGDLLLERFANVIERYKEARQTKRMVAKELEKEVAQREELVRTKITAVERDLTGLKHAGRKVVQGKYT